jgi:radical SAM protein with 4Fe4S-binding SPASM domain
VDCLYAPPVSITQFYSQIEDRIVADRIPISGAMEITSRCNLRCAHCFLGHEPTTGELSTPQVCAIIDQVAAEGCLWFLISGGEPLVRPDFLDIYAHAKQKGLLLSLFTNGTLVTPEIADYLWEWPPVEVEITLYGATPETYERVTGVPGSFQRAVRGIDLLLERGIQVRLKTVVMTWNRHELEAMQAFAASRGCAFYFDTSVRPRLDGSQEPCALRIPVEDVVALDQADEQRAMEWREACRTKLEQSDSDRLYNCGAGANSFSIDAHGRLHICTFARHPGYDLTQGSFHEGWYQAVPEARRTRVQRQDLACLRCDKAFLCGRCPAWAEVENGDPETVVDYICQIAHLRAVVFS